MDSPNKFMMDQCLPNVYALQHISRRGEQQAMGFSADIFHQSKNMFSAAYLQVICRTIYR
jgi:hypothetical protein